MKLLSYLLIFCVLLAGLSCKKLIDVYPVSNLYDAAFYRNIEEVNVALTGCYNGMQKPLYDEWSMTELRSDNSIMGNPTSGSSDNRELSDLDMFMPNTYHEGIYNYWLHTYYNIYNVNKVLKSISVNYSVADSTLTYDSLIIPMNADDRYRISAEASFIRAYHYFNLVRLYGGVFLIDKPLSPEDSKKINRSSVDDIYRFIIADLKNSIFYGNSNSYGYININDVGRVNVWSAKALLAKVYLTLNRKNDAALLLNDIIQNSGYSLQPNYASVFSIINEMNSEILFAVRYKAGSLGIGSPFANLFAANGSGLAVVNGDGKGYNYPATELISAYSSTDPRLATNISRYITKWYVNKYISNVVIANDAENDWPVIRYADVLLMLAEAQGFSPSSIDLINLIRVRSGQPALTVSTINSVALFEKALSNERRLEFAFENQRWFDLVRFNNTMTTVKAEDVMKIHVALMYSSHYGKYPAPALTLAQIQSYITPEHLLLPIPQREIDNNTFLHIDQNPGY
jgi:hypothetical protein